LIEELAFDGISIGKLNLYVKTKTTTRCKTVSGTSFERKLRNGNQEENNGKFKTDKVFLCKPLLSAQKPIF